MPEPALKLEGKAITLVTYHPDKSRLNTKCCVKHPIHFSHTISIPTPYVLIEWSSSFTILFNTLLRTKY